MTITAAADGSALGNPGPTGWAWYVSEDSWAAGGSAHGTNNIGELTAVLELLNATRQAGRAGEELLILCDSQYVINSVTKWMPGWKRKGWKKADGKPVLNVDLMKAIDAAMSGRSVRFEWVKGHAGHAMNEAADERARAAATAFQKGATVDAGPGFHSEEASSQDADTGAIKDHCVAILSPPEAERVLWHSEADPAASLDPDAVLVDTRGRTLDAAAWSSGVRALRSRGAVAEGDPTSLPLGDRLTLVDHVLAASGSRFRIVTLWREDSGTLVIAHQHWSVIS